LDADRFRRITRGGDLRAVLAGIHAALDVGMSVKLNVVLVRGENEHEARGLVQWAWERGIVPRFIELMPLGEGAKLADRRVTADEVRALLGDLVDGSLETGGEDHGPARYARSAEHDARVGFITPLSDEFCGTCNRVRITAMGDVRACLASRRALSLRDVMREGGDDRALAWAIHLALAGKARGHFFTDADVVEHERVGMSLIGG
jgi:cyclic pyranopterin phosphate synthase